jgi:hypothetical protein
MRPKREKERGGSCTGETTLNRGVWKGQEFDDKNGVLLRRTLFLLFTVLAVRKAIIRFLVERT